MACAEFAMDELKKIKEAKFEEPLVKTIKKPCCDFRNVPKLNRLSEGLLQVSKPENGTFTIHIVVQLKQILSGAIEDTKKKGCRPEQRLCICCPWTILKQGNS
jgi:hypothetical protein